MHELSAPLRLTWDLTSDPASAHDLWLRIAEGRVLLLEIRLQDWTITGLSGLPSQGSKRGPRISFLGEAEVLLAGVRLLRWLHPGAADLLVLPPYGSKAARRQLREAGYALSPALWSTPEGLAHLEQARALAAEAGSARVAILNAPAPAAPLGPEDRERAARVWNARRLPSLEVRVHDLFLAEELGLTPFETYEGCQAAATLAHLSHDGRVFACRSLATELGDLREQTLAEIWAGTARRELRARLAEPPPECRPCGLAPKCGGGCRGLAAELGRDPSCGRTIGTQSEGIGP